MWPLALGKIHTFAISQFSVSNLSNMILNLFDVFILHTE